MSSEKIETFELLALKRLRIAGANAALVANAAQIVAQQADMELQAYVVELENKHDVIDKKVSIDMDTGAIISLGEDGKPLSKEELKE